MWKHGALDSVLGHVLPSRLLFGSSVASVPRDFPKGRITVVEDALQFLPFANSLTHFTCSETTGDKGRKPTTWPEAVVFEFAEP